MFHIIVIIIICEFVFLYKFIIIIIIIIIGIENYFINVPAHGQVETRNLLALNCKILAHYVMNVEFSNAIKYVKKYF